MKTLELKIPPVALVLLFALLMWILRKFIPGFDITLPWAKPLAIGLGALGVLIPLLGALEFRKLATTVDPRTPERATSLAQRGVYRYTRNPMYLGFLLILTAWAIYLAHGLVFLMLPLFVVYMNRFQIMPEERCMATLFGDQYSKYTNNVRRWI